MQSSRIRPRHFVRDVARAAAAVLLASAGWPVYAIAQDAEPTGWTVIERDEAARPERTQRITPAKFARVRLDLNRLRASLDASPREEEAAQEAFAEITLPDPTGRPQRFRVAEAPVMAPALAAKYPQIRTYVAYGIDDPHARGRLDRTPKGFHAQVLTPAGSWYIDPLFEGDTATHASYYKRDYVAPAGRGVHPCLIDPNAEPPNLPAVGGVASAGLPAAAGTFLKTYRLAVAATAEYTAYHGGTVVDGLAAVVTAINRVTGIYETELAIRFELVANNDLIIFTNTIADGYSNSNGGAMLSQNITKLNQVIGSSNYDIGHVFSTGGGGVAFLGVVCSNSKAGGVTGLPQPIGDPFYVDYVAHEMGHQCGGRHTFNGTQGSCASNRSAAVAVEPGSGSTIMAYAGICGSDNIQNRSDPYFHAASFEEIRAYMLNPFGGGICGPATDTNNEPPVVSAGPSYTIPQQTAFELTATGSDPDGDDITFQWEQMDTGLAQQVSQPDNAISPLFRSFPPTTSPSRTFPRIDEWRFGQTVVGEKLPQTNRDLEFRVTARDNRAGGGGVASDEQVYFVTTSAGPFEVTEPLAGAFVDGEFVVRWDVAGTDVAPVDAPLVDIYLSTDDGFTYDLPLALGVPNDGEATVTPPGVFTSTARVRVQGTDHIFFALNPGSFSIESCENPPAAGFEVGGFDKSRFISFDPRSAGTLGAIEVTLADLPAPFDAFNGEVRFVGPPQAFESNGDEGVFYAAELQCEPWLGNFVGIETLHVFGSAVVPGATYDVRVNSCDLLEPTFYSAPTALGTGLWGDIVEPFGGEGEAQPDVLDILSAVDKLLGSPGAPIRARTKFVPSLVDPSRKTDINDVLAVVDSFLGQPYPFSGPQVCP